jgi:Holliday junction DNA helicase RuvA
LYIYDRLYTYLVIYSLEGIVTHTGPHFLVIDVNGCGYKVTMPASATIRFTVGDRARIFTRLHSNENAMELYGFEREETLHFFEQLLNVSGVGPRLALAVLDAVDLQDLAAAIEENRPDLIAQAPGVGRKTSERIIIELRGKLSDFAPADAVKRMDTDTDLVEALTELGYRKEDVRRALRSIDPAVVDLQDRLKHALAQLGGTKK